MFGFGKKIKKLELDGELENGSDVQETKSSELENNTPLENVEETSELEIKAKSKNKNKIILISSIAASALLVAAAIPFGLQMLNEQPVEENIPAPMPVKIAPNPLAKVDNNYSTNSLKPTENNNSNPLQVANNVLTQNPVLNNNSTQLNTNNPVVNIQPVNQPQKIVNGVAVKIEQHPTIVNNPNEGKILNKVAQNGMVGEKDIFTLTDKNAVEMKNAEKYIEDKQSYYDKLTKYYEKKKAAEEKLESLKTFQTENAPAESKQLVKLRKEMQEQNANLQKQLNEANQKLNAGNLDNIKANIVQNYEKDIMNNIDKVKIFAKDNELIAVITQNGQDNVFKKGDRIGNFSIKNIYNTYLVVENSGQLFNVNVKKDTAQQKYIPISIPISGSKEKMDDYKQATTDIIQQNSAVKQYPTPTNTGTNNGIQTNKQDVVQKLNINSR